MDGIFFQRHKTLEKPRPPSLLRHSLSMARRINIKNERERSYTMGYFVLALLS